MDNFLKKEKERDKKIVRNGYNIIRIKDPKNKKIKEETILNVVLTATHVFNTTQNNIFVYELDGDFEMSFRI